MSSWIWSGGGVAEIESVPLYTKLVFEAPRLNLWSGFFRKMCLTWSLQGSFCKVVWGRKTHSAGKKIYPFFLRGDIPKENKHFQKKILSQPLQELFPWTTGSGDTRLDAAIGCNKEDVFKKLRAGIQPRWADHQDAFNKEDIFKMSRLPLLPLNISSDETHLCLGCDIAC